MTSWRSDPDIEPFLGESFDPNAFSSRLLSGAANSALTKMNELSDSIKSLGEQIKNEVVSRHGDLLQTAGQLRDLESDVLGVSLSIKSLQTSTQRIRTDLLEPYRDIQSKTRQLRAVQDAIDFLRLLTQRLKLVAKLKQVLPSGAALAAPLGQLDLAKAAKILADIETAEAGVDLSGIEIADADLSFIRDARTLIRTRAQELLTSGLEALNQAEVGSSLLVFYNLNELREVVTLQLNAYVADIDKSVTAALDPKKLGGAAGAGAATGLFASLPGGVRGMPQGGALAESLLERVEEVGAAIHRAAWAVWQLHKVLSKKRDPLTHVLFSEVVATPSEPSLMDAFWAKVAALLAKKIEAAVRPTGAPFVREALVNQLPRVMGTLQGSLQKIEADTAVRGLSPALSPAARDAFWRALHPLQAAYLAQALGRLTEAINGAFSGSSRSLPSASEVQACVVKFGEEIRAAGPSEPLASALCRTACTALQMVSSKVEYMMAAAAETRAVAGPAQAAHQRNFALAAAVGEMERQLDMLRATLPEPAAEALGPGLAHLQACVFSLLSPPLRAMQDQLEADLLQLHSVPYGDAPTAATAVTAAAADGNPAAAVVLETSRFVLQFAQHAAHYRQEYLQRMQQTAVQYALDHAAIQAAVAAGPMSVLQGGARAPSSPPPPALMNQQRKHVTEVLAERLATRCLVLFLRHASLLPALGPAGKLQLAKDLGDLETAVGQSLCPVEHLGAAHRALRGFRHVLFVETPQLPQHPSVRDVPAVVLAHHLLTRAGGTLPTPLARAGLSPAQYSVWLDTHALPEVLRGLRSCLEGAGGREGAGEVASIIRQLCDVA